jgi:hypothetical protein
VGDKNQDQGPGATIIALDFTEYDTIAACEMLLKLAREGRLQGMVFAAGIADGSNIKRKRMLGATGRAADDLEVASGLSAILHSSLTQAARDEINGHWARQDV